MEAIERATPAGCRGPHPAPCFPPSRRLLPSCWPSRPRANSRSPLRSGPWPWAGAGVRPERRSALEAVVMSTTSGLSISIHDALPHSTLLGDRRAEGEEKAKDGAVSEPGAGTNTARGVRLSGPWEIEKDNEDGTSSARRRSRSTLLLAVPGSASRPSDSGTGAAFAERAAYGRQGLVLPRLHGIGVQLADWVSRTGRSYWLILHCLSARLLLSPLCGLWKGKATSPDSAGGVRP